MYNNSTIEDLEQLKESLKQEYLEQTGKIDQIIALIKSTTEGNPSEKRKLNVIPSFVARDNNELSHKYITYKKGMGYKQKMAAILKAEGKFLTVKEISDILYSLEPEISYEAIKTGVGSAKSALLKENIIVKYKVGASNNNSFYGSKNWLDENGNPKPEHMYNEQVLISTKEEIEI